MFGFLIGINNCNTCLSIDKNVSNFRARKEMLERSSIGLVLFSAFGTETIFVSTERCDVYIKYFVHIFKVVTILFKNGISLNLFRNYKIFYL